MATKALPSPEVLRQLLRYEPETGKLFWLPRQVEMFTASSSASAKYHCDGWNKRFAGKEAFTADDGLGYRQGAIFGRLFRAHRVIMALQNGEWPKNSVDHVDGDTANNRAKNLRLATAGENAQNRRIRSDNRSGFKGVHRSWTGKAWYSQIKVGGKVYNLGTFRCPTGAAIAYARASKKLHGSFGRLS